MLFSGLRGPRFNFYKVYTSPVAYTGNLIQKGYFRARLKWCVFMNGVSLYLTRVNKYNYVFLGKEESL